MCTFDGIRQRMENPDVVMRTVSLEQGLSQILAYFYPDGIYKTRAANIRDVANAATVIITGYEFAREANRHVWLCQKLTLLVLFSTQ